MALIPINPAINKVADILPKLGLALITSSSDFATEMSPPQILMQKYFRSGLNADNIASNIMGRFKEAGIPSGPLVNGATNVMEAFTLIIAEEIVDAIQNQMRVSIAVNPGGMVNANGANSGGPMVAVGATTNIQIGTGIAV